MKTLLTNLAIMVVGWLINQVKDEDVVSAGTQAGKWLTDNAREKLGDGWEKIEGKLQSKVDTFMGGLYVGLDYDDPEKE